MKFIEVYGRCRVVDVELPVSVVGVTVLVLLVDARNCSKIGKGLDRLVATFIFL
jgi:hypothetical protein